MAKRKTNNNRPLTERTKLVKVGNATMLPISKKLLSKVKATNKSLYLTAIDGVLQLSGEAPTLMIPILVQPEARFGAQSN